MEASTPSISVRWDPFGRAFEGPPWSVQWRRRTRIAPEPNPLQSVGIRSAHGRAECHRAAPIIWLALDYSTEQHHAARDYQVDSFFISMMRKWLTSLRGERVAFTGGMWVTRSGLRRELERRGGVLSTVFAASILVRGTSPKWKYGDHGIKERQAATLIREGEPISLVHESEFRKLLEEGRPARVADQTAGEQV
jgi:hypothetical protein